MKPHERRKQNAYPYYKLARWDARLACWVDGKRTFETRDDAQHGTEGRGRYRISVITDRGRKDDLEFEVK